MSSDVQYHFKLRSDTTATVENGKRPLSDNVDRIIWGRVVGPMSDADQMDGMTLGEWGEGQLIVSGHACAGKRLLPRIRRPVTTQGLS